MFLLLGPCREFNSFVRTNTGGELPMQEVYVKGVERVRMGYLEREREM